MPRMHKDTDKQKALRHQGTLNPRPLLEELLPRGLSSPLRRRLNSLPREDSAMVLRLMSCPRLARAPWIRR
jgi:hypothetical protein